MLNDVWFRASLQPHPPPYPLAGGPLKITSVNYCLTGLIDKGYIKLENFRHADNRLAYAYHLTPEGIQAKLQLTCWLLKRRLKEYAEIRQEIQTLSTELADQNPELLSDLDFKGILTPPPTSQT